MCQEGMLTLVKIRVQLSPSAGTAWIMNSLKGTVGWEGKTSHEQSQRHLKHPLSHILVSFIKTTMVENKMSVSASESGHWKLLSEPNFLFFCQTWNRFGKTKYIKGLTLSPVIFSNENNQVYFPSGGKISCKSNLLWPCDCLEGSSF